MDNFSSFLPQSLSISGLQSVPQAVVDEYAAQRPQIQSQPMPVAAPAPAEEIPLADKYELQRQQITNYKTKVLSNAAKIAASLAPEQGNAYRSSVEKVLEQEYPQATLKPFTETKQYEIAQKDAERLKSKATPMKMLGEGLKTASALLATGNPADKEEALTTLRMDVMKNLNSLVSPDAVSVGEAMLRYRSLLSAFEINTAQNASILSPKGILMKLNDLSPDELQKQWDNLKNGKESLFDRVRSQLSNVMQAQPEKFVKAASNVYNDISKPFNYEVDSIIKRTSPRYTFEHFGIEKAPTFSMEPVPQQEAPAAPAPPTMFTPSMSGSVPAYAPAPAAAVQPAKSGMDKIYRDSMFRVK